MATTADSVEAYIASRPAAVQPILAEIRQLIGRLAPDSGEKISYQMPTVTVGGRAVFYYAAWAKHIGFYPIPGLDPELEQEIAPYRSGQDSVRFPLKDPIPYPLIERLVAALF